MTQLDAYLERIGVEPKASPDLALLHDVLIGHACSIPFEHLDVLRGIGISLEPDAIFHKLVTKRRGGYCFEQNNLLCRMLSEMGFKCRLLSGRVRIEQPRDFTPPETHVFVVATVEGEDWIFDCGMGGFSMTAPIRFVRDVPQQTPHDVRRIVFEEGKYFHQVLRGDWTDLYEFIGEEMPEIDQTVANWYTSTHPRSKFKTRLAVGLAQRDGTRIGLLNDRFIHRKGTDVLRDETVSNQAVLRGILASEFGIDLPPDFCLDGWPFNPQSTWTSSNASITSPAS